MVEPHRFGFQSRPSREGFCKDLGGPAGRVMQSFNPVQAGKGSASPESYLAALHAAMFQSRPSREGFCKGLLRRFVRRRRGVSIPSKPGRVLQAGAWSTVEVASCFNPVQAGKGSARVLHLAGVTRSQFQSRPSREGFCKRRRRRCSTAWACFNPVQAGKGSASDLLPRKGVAPRFQSRPSREGVCKTTTATPTPKPTGFQSRPSREGFCKRCGVSRRVLQPSFNPVQAGKGSASEIHQATVSNIKRFQSRPSREGFCKYNEMVEGLEADLFQSRPSREGFCKLAFGDLRQAAAARFNPVQAGKGSARPSSRRPSRRPTPPRFQSRPSREGFCKDGYGFGDGYGSGYGFNPVQAGKGSARDRDGRHAPGPPVSIPSKPGRVLQARRGHARGSDRGFQSRPSREGFCKKEEKTAILAKWEFQSRPSREGFCKQLEGMDESFNRKVSIPSKPGRVLQGRLEKYEQPPSVCFNPVQAGKGSASLNLVANAVEGDLKFQSRPSREGFCKFLQRRRPVQRRVSIPSKPGRVLQGWETTIPYGSEYFLFQSRPSREGFCKSRRTT